LCSIAPIVFDTIKLVIGFLIIGKRKLSIT
jgi:hypothetical protein